jgi:hypothetical protein
MSNAEVSRGDDPPYPPVSAWSGQIAKTAIVSGPTMPTKVPGSDPRAYQGPPGDGPRTPDKSGGVPRFWAAGSIPD